MFRKAKIPVDEPPPPKVVPIPKGLFTGKVKKQLDEIAVYREIQKKQRQEALMKQSKYPSQMKREDLTKKKNKAQNNKVFEIYIKFYYQKLYFPFLFRIHLDLKFDRDQLQIFNNFMNILKGI